MIIRRFAKRINNRKDLVNKISSITGLASRYTGVPSLAYEIGNFVVEKDGTLAVTMTEDGREGAVILALRADGIIGEEIRAPKTAAEIEAAEIASIIQTAHSVEADSSENEQEEQEAAVDEFVPVNDEKDEDDFSSIGIEDWEPEDEKTEQAKQPSELQQPVAEEPQQFFEVLEEQEIEPQQFAGEFTDEEDDAVNDSVKGEADETTDESTETSTTVRSMRTARTSSEATVADVDEADKEAPNFAVSFPLSKHTPTSIINLVCMIYSRGPLLSKATGGFFSASKELADALLDHGTFLRTKDVVRFINEYAASLSDKHSGTANPAEIAEGESLVGLRFNEDAGTVIFDGFASLLGVPSPDSSHIKAFTALATAMNKMAQKQKRIQAKTVNDANEKYALRIWLVRLDMNGDDHKEDRKILMENLTGHTAFRTDAEKEKWTKRQLAKKLALKEQKRLAKEQSTATDAQSLAGIDDSVDEDSILAD